MKRFYIALIFLFVVVLSACEKKSSPETNETKNVPPSRIPEEDQWKKQKWIERVAGRLRYRKPLSRADNLNELMQMSEEEIVNHFMKSPEFINTVLDFNMFFYGFLIPNLYTTTDVAYSQRVYLQAGAINAAKEVANNGDFLKLVSFQQPYNLSPLGKPQKTKPEHANMTDTELRQWYRKDIKDYLDATIAELDRTVPDINAACLTFSASENFYTKMIKMGDSRVNADYVFSDRKWAGDFFNYCFDRPSVIPEGTLESMRALPSKLMPFIDELISLAERDYNPLKISDMVSHDPATTASVPYSRFIENGLIYYYMQNSSTNFNRRRSSYFLKRFFCDDLTPINVTVPARHVRGRHVSDASCVACHYKLDPLAGFFKYLGRAGNDYSIFSMVVLDDLVKVQKEEYDKEWKNDDGTWNIGYIRSIENRDRNDYGENIEDLFRIIKKSPELKSCIVKRVHEYFLAEDQLIDAGYIEDLTQKFTAEANTNSAIAFKNLISRVVRSNAFHEDNRKADQCYDFVGDPNANDRPPCRVAAVLERNCVTCHSSSSPSGGLVLNKWIRLNDGTYNFPHVVGANRNQLSARESLRRITQRLTSSNADLRMPLERYISFKDREILYLWSQGAK